MYLDDSQMSLLLRQCFCLLPLLRLRSQRLRSQRLCRMRECTNNCVLKKRKEELIEGMTSG
jgi:hypothetical protein